MAISTTMQSQVWKMLNELRGKIEPSEYKNYVFGLMFYKFLSDREENYVKDNAVDFDDLSLQDAWESAEDEVIELLQQEIGYYIQPSELYSEFVKTVDAGTFSIIAFTDAISHFNAQILNDPNDQRAQHALKDIFADMDLTSNRLGADVIDRTQTLTKMICFVEDMAVDLENDGDVLGDIYEYLISMFAMTSGNKAGEFYTPHQVSKLMARILSDGHDTDTEFSMYDPTMGSGSLLLTMADNLPEMTTIKYYGQELNTTTYNLARMNLAMRGINYNNMALRNGDTLGLDWPDGIVDGMDSPAFFDAVMANPPYSLSWNTKDREDDPRFRDYGVAPKSYADYAFLLHSLYHLKDNGRMAIVLPHGVLFRGGAEGKIRQALLKENKISAVIGLPANIFTNTSIPTVILILEKHRSTNGVLFIDGSKGFEKQKKNNVLRDEDIDKIFDAYKAGVDVDKFAHYADTAELVENDFNLNIPRYVDTFEAEEPVDLIAVSGHIKSLDQDIETNEAELLTMLNDLVGDDAVLDAVRDVFKK